MSSRIFVNLPVRDLARSKAFFGALGYAFDARFSDDKAACVAISDRIFVMLLTEAFFQTFTGKAIADARATTEVLVCLGEDSRQGVDERVDKALAAGATPVRPAQDHGFMYERSFSDLDGHIWEIMWMNEAAAG